MICLQDAAASPQDRPAGLTAADAAMSHTHTPPEIVWQRRQSGFERKWMLLSNRKHRQVVSVEIRTRRSDRLISIFLNC